MTVFPPLIVLGMCLTAGTLAAIVGTVGAGFFVELLGSFQGFILLTAILYLLSALFYNIYSTGERVDFDTTGPSHLLFSGLCRLLSVFCFRALCNGLSFQYIASF